MQEWLMSELFRGSLGSIDFEILPSFKIIPRVSILSPRNVERGAKYPQKGSSASENDRPP